METSHRLNVRVREFRIPPIRDALVLGRDSPIGCEAMRKSLQLLVSSPFEHIEVDDPVISDILVRAGILRRLPQQMLVDFCLSTLRPHMGSEEIVHLHIDVELLLSSVERSAAP